ncbi:MAG: hypothetical protein GX091_07940 [Peptococcaceae bacterium]|nr:hypothetical protein [Peptococcaceae bacterium]
MRNKNQKIIVVIIIALLCVALIGSSFVAIFHPGMDTSEDDGQRALTNEYNQWKQTVDILKQKSAENPDDLQTKIDLGNAYYLKSRVTAQLNINEYREDLKKAIEIYQDILQTKEDSDIQLKMANAAFLLGDTGLAEEAYEDLLQKEPENPEVLFGYGMYLLYFKDDYEQALMYWRKALPLVEDEDFRQNLQDMISQAEEIGKNAK